MKDFIYVIRPVRKGMIDDIKPEEEQILDEHFEYLKSALDLGRLVLAGPCLDGTFGIVIFHAEDENEAEMFMKDDPAVKNNIMTAELHSFRISLG